MLYPTKNGIIIKFNINDVALRPFGVYHGELLDTLRGKAHVIGLINKELWIAYEDSLGAEPVKGTNYQDLCDQDIYRVFNKLDLEDVERLKLLYHDKEFADLTFLVDGHELKAHKCILSQRSKYFRTMFTNGMRESRDDVIKIDAPFESFEKVIYFIYTGNIKIDNPAELVEIAILADMYLIENLQELCINRLACFSNEILFVLEHCNHIPFMKEACFKGVFYNWEHLTNSDEFFEILHRHPSLEKELLKAIQPQFSPKQNKKFENVSSEDKTKILAYLRQIAEKTLSPTDTNKIIQCMEEPKLFQKPENIKYIEKELKIPIPFWFTEKYLKS